MENLDWNGLVDLLALGLGAGWVLWWIVDSFGEVFWTVDDLIDHMF